MEAWERVKGEAGYPEKCADCIHTQDCHVQYLAQKVDAGVLTPQRAAELAAAFVVAESFAVSMSFSSGISVAVARSLTLESLKEVVEGDTKSPRDRALDRLLGKTDGEWTVMDRGWFGHTTNSAK
jgi:Na+(H+)/acetate symporter ActP